MDVVLNPLSKAAQRVAPILEWLRSSFRASIKVKLAWSYLSELVPPDEHLVLTAVDQYPDYPSISVQPSCSVEDVHPSSPPASPEERLLSGSGLVQLSNFQNQAFYKSLQCPGSFSHCCCETQRVLSVAGILEPREGAVRHAFEDLLQIRFTRALASW